MIKKAFGTHKIAEICQVTPPTVWQWIKEGRLPSFTTGGGHHRVWSHDLVEFLKAHNMPVPPELSASLSSKILVVDDEPAIRELVKKTIERSLPQFEIHLAKDGFEAGHKVTLLMPALVVLDLCLPGMDGIKVCEMIKQNESLRGVKVLVITGYEIEKSRKKIVEAGAEGFLEKPFKPENLIDEIQKLLGIDHAGNLKGARHD